MLQQQRQDPPACTTITHDGDVTIDKMWSLVRKAEYSMWNMSLAALCMKALNSAELPIKGWLTSVEFTPNDYNDIGSSHINEISSDPIPSDINTFIATRNKSAMDEERELVGAELDL